MHWNLTFCVYPIIGCIKALMSNYLLLGDEKFLVSFPDNLSEGKQVCNNYHSNVSFPENTKPSLIALLISQTRP